MDGPHDSELAVLLAGGLHGLKVDGADDISDVEVLVSVVVTAMGIKGIGGGGVGSIAGREIIWEGRKGFKMWGVRR